MQKKENGNRKYRMDNCINIQKYHAERTAVFSERTAGKEKLKYAPLYINIPESFPADFGDRKGKMREVYIIIDNNSGQGQEKREKTLSRGKKYLTINGREYILVA